MIFTRSAVFLTRISSNGTLSKSPLGDTLSMSLLCTFLGSARHSGSKALAPFEFVYATPPRLGCADPMWDQEGDRLRRDFEVTLDACLPHPLLERAECLDTSATTFRYGSSHNPSCLDTVTSWLAGWPDLA